MRCTCCGTEAADVRITDLGPDGPEERVLCVSCAERDPGSKTYFKPRRFWLRRTGKASASETAGGFSLTRVDAASGREAFEEHLARILGTDAGNMVVQAVSGQVFLSLLGRRALVVTKGGEPVAVVLYRKGPGPSRIWLVMDPLVHPDHCETASVAAIVHASADFILETEETVEALWVGFSRECGDLRDRLAGLGYEPGPPPEWFPR